MKSLGEILKGLEIGNIWVNQDDEYTTEILDEIKKWLEEESEKEEYLEEKFRGE